MTLTRRKPGPPTPPTGGTHPYAAPADPCAAPADPYAAPADPYAALGDPDPDVRRHAVLDLAGRPEALDVLLAHVGREPDSAVRQATLTAIARSDSPAAAAGLTPYVRGDDAVLRNAALEAIAAMPTAAAALVPELLADPDPDVRILTATLLAQSPWPDAAPRLAQVLAGEEHPNVVAAALDAFLPLAAADHVALLVEVRDRFPADPFIRFTIDAALPDVAGR